MSLEPLPVSGARLAQAMRKPHALPWAADVGATGRAPRQAPAVRQMKQVADERARHRRPAPYRAARAHRGTVRRSDRARVRIRGQLCRQRRAQPRDRDHSAPHCRAAHKQTSAAGRRSSRSSRRFSTAARPGLIEFARSTMTDRRHAGWPIRHEARIRYAECAINSVGIVGSSPLAASVSANIWPSSEPMSISAPNGYGCDR